MTKIAINGFGRIGRPSLKIALEKENLEVVAINDLTDLKTAAHLLKYDSSFGQYNRSIEINEESSEIVVNGKTIKYFSEKDPESLPWGEMGVEIVLECTGAFEDREKSQKHIAAGAKKVILSSPPKGDIPVYLIGVNEENYNSEVDHIISNGSCTTNCLAPMIKVLDDSFGLEKGFMTTTHSYTNDQRLQDLPHRDLRRARAAALNIIPTTTGAAKTVGLVMPHLEGKLDGISLRVPTPVVSIVDFICNVKREVDADEVNEAFKKSAQEKMKTILAVEEEQLVSMDFKGNPNSAIVDLSLTMANGNLVKVVGWYDNEWGYSNRLVELAEIVSNNL
ncbi:MAG TPA: type I glyceraldehyde-3-phosphate dehydrogenase [Candidatus Moranbacteria bacterium]|nr:type I glyceraldehyde-3-phosphate dehydrogenase [Candidatus Moranbacteria bacterium]